MSTLQSVIQAFERQQRPIRIVAMGSSNTQRPANIGNVQNWVDWVDLMLGVYFGRCHITINVGISGQTTSQMLERFDREVVFFRPHVVFITGGGNDSNPAKNVPIETFRGNLTEMIGRARTVAGCVPILQTYYSFDEEALNARGDGAHAAAFHAYMQATRDVARQTNCLLIDHLKRWEEFRNNDISLYRQQMIDPQHLNGSGHLLFALDVMRALGCPMRDGLLPSCQAGLTLQRKLDEISGRKK